MISACRLTLVLVGVALVSGCSVSAVGVRRMDPRTVERSLTANALNANEPSADTRDVLYRLELDESFGKSPAWTLAALHRIAVTENDSDATFALAELCLLHAARSHDRRYALMAAIYAWSFLFGGEAPEPVDPRLRVAIGLYNHGLAQGLEEDGEGGVTLAGGSVALPIGELQIRFDPSVLDWNGRRLRDFVPVAELEVYGLAPRFRRSGIGAALAASAAATDIDASPDFLAPRLKTPVTALLRFEDVRRQLASGRIDATLELHTDANEALVQVGTNAIPLHWEPTAALAAMFEEEPVIRQEIQTFFGTFTRRQGAGRLMALAPHVRGRVPVVFVHGTTGSPARWVQMVNVLDNDPWIRERFEPWFFTYNSGGPVLYSSYLLRSSLTEAVARLDPDGSDAGLHDMVVIGHSQGGLLAKMTAVRSGDEFWKGMSKRPFDEIRVTDEQRALLRSVMFVEPLPFVHRVVFICTPHRGGSIGAGNWILSLASLLISLPARLKEMTADLLTRNPGLRSVTSLSGTDASENMAPSNHFVRALATLPVAPGVVANSIIAVKEGQAIETGDDGVVEYQSAHLDGVESELVVRSSHRALSVRATIEEVRRILRESAGAPGPAATPKPTAPAH